PGGTANAMDVEFALTRERKVVILQARPYTLVYSLDRMQRDRPVSASRVGWYTRLRRLAHLVGAAVQRRRGAARLS
ncbi:MAG: hypothetical protein RL087_77, partial [Pseudomonadota bacterium]